MSSREKGQESLRRSGLGVVPGRSGHVGRGQTIERDTTITGPRGRSIQRDVEIQRGRGSIDRQVTIKRPGGTFTRDMQIQRSPADGRGPIPGPWPRPPWLGPRPLVIAQPAPALGFGLMAAPMLNFSFGGGGGGMGCGGGGGLGGGGMGGGGMPGGPGGQAPPPPDQVALECQRLQALLSGTRKEAAYNLGRMGDPRAVPSLIHVLKYDNFKDVRVASAIALGEIGGSDAAVALERSSIYDHREDVRKAATTALDRLNTKAQAQAARMQQQAAAMPPGYGRPAVQPPSPQPPVGGQPAPPATSSPFREGCRPRGRSRISVLRVTVPPNSRRRNASSPRRRRRPRSPGVRAGRIPDAEVRPVRWAGRPSSRRRGPARAVSASGAKEAARPSQDLGTTRCFAGLKGTCEAWLRPPTDGRKPDRCEAGIPTRSCFSSISPNLAQRIPGPHDREDKPGPTRDVPAQATRSRGQEPPPWSINPGDTDGTGPAAGCPIRTPWKTGSRGSSRRSATKADGVTLHPVIEEFRELIDRDPIVRMYRHADDRAGAPRQAVYASGTWRASTRCCS